VFRYPVYEDVFRVAVFNRVFAFFPQTSSPPTSCLRAYVFRALRSFRFVFDLLGSARFSLIAFDLVRTRVSITRRPDRLVRVFGWLERDRIGCNSRKAHGSSTRNSRESVFRIFPTPVSVTITFSLRTYRANFNFEKRLRQYIHIKEGDFFKKKKDFRAIETENFGIPSDRTRLG